MAQEKELEVAILMSEIRDTHEIGRVFRQIGHIPCFYEKTSDFWESLNESMPSLAVIDVKMMAQEDIFLSDHPCIKNKLLPIIFVCGDDSLLLLQTTFDLYSIGLIHKSLGFAGQLKSLLLRYNKIFGLERALASFDKKNSESLDRVRALENINQSLKQKIFYANFVQKLENCFEQKELQNKDLFSSCCEVFSKIEEIESYSICELDEEEVRLFSKASSSVKYKTLPPIGLSSKAIDGIPSHILDMAHLEAMNVLGAKVMPILIKGVQGTIRKVIYLKLKRDDFLHHIDWQRVERFLSGKNASFENMLFSAINMTQKNATIWDLLSTLDKYVYDNSGLSQVDANEIALLNIDLSAVVDLAEERFPKRFFWSSFYKEFIGKLKLRTHLKFEVISTSYKSIALVIDYKNNEALFVLVRDYLLHFPYWRFFSHGDTLLAVDLTPKLKMIPLSSKAYLHVLAGLENKIDHSIVNEKKTETSKELVEEIIIKSNKNARLLAKEIFN